MQRDEFLQQLWLDYIHCHPDIGALSLWPPDIHAEYCVLVTVNREPYQAQRLLPALYHFGYRRVGHHAMADRGVLANMLSPGNDDAWIVLIELQLDTLTQTPRHHLEALIKQSHPQDSRGQNLLSRGRPWPMPDWATYQQLQAAHPLAAWLAIMGPRMHHVGFDCQRLGREITEYADVIAEAGLKSGDQTDALLPISPLLEHRYYACCTQRAVFAAGDEHRVTTGGLALVQKRLPGTRERAAELLLPQHTRCELSA
ncbi:DUF1338 family protein [Chromohalobacter sp. HP20-39]|uniref:DUF1338 family protein n=1 Tax=Chromohalobacter sp. HP20-39 TaxID=3079306 RepID=UPI00294A9D0E|nr:DUF1338 family protein [Chromohalobacter sp. HP20-39]MDV6320114.1 DUF1338 family protein [Chromohalobacter sp. HP20-39]